MRFLQGDDTPTGGEVKNGGRLRRRTWSLWALKPTQDPGGDPVRPLRAARMPGGGANEVARRDSVENAAQRSGRGGLSKRNREYRAAGERAAKS